MQIKTEMKLFRMLAIFLSVILFCAGILLTLGIFVPISGYVPAETVLFRIGRRVFSVYGFSAFLIPLFFLYGAVLLLIPGWSRESKATLLGVPFYFVTAIIGERLIYAFSPSVSIPVIRHFVIVSILICALLLICFEIFLMLAVSEKLAGRRFFIHTEPSEDIISETYEMESEIPEPAAHDTAVETVSDMPAVQLETQTDAAFDPVTETVSDESAITDTDCAESAEPVICADTGSEETVCDSNQNTAVMIQEDTVEKAADTAEAEEILPFLEGSEAQAQQEADLQTIEETAGLIADGTTEPSDSDAFEQEVDITEMPEPSMAVEEVEEETVEPDNQALPLSTPLAAVISPVENQEAAFHLEFDPSDPDNLFDSLEEITAPIERIKRGEYIYEPKEYTTIFAEETENTEKYPAVSAVQEESATTDEAESVEVSPSVQEETEAAETVGNEVQYQEAAALKTDESGVSHSISAVSAETPELVDQSTGGNILEPFEAEEEEVFDENWEPAMPLVFTNGVPLPNERSDLLDTLVVIEAEPSASFEPVHSVIPAQICSEAEEAIAEEKTVTDEMEEPENEDEGAAEAIAADEVFLEKIEQTAALPCKPIQPPRKKYAIPFDLLTDYPDGEYWIIDDATRKAAFMLKSTFNEFKIDVSITGIRKGPVVTMFEMLPSPGIKLSRITNLQDNIALRLAASSVRVVAPIPGKHAVGIEVPNKKRAIVSFRELIETDLPESSKMAIPVVLGKDVTGNPQLLDLAQTPHLLIAGATGSGKSVCVNSIILSILYNRRPDEVKLILVDPKIVELKLYNDIAHLLTPVITEPKRAFQALQYALCEMERRYALLDNLGVRDIKTFNSKIKSERIATEALPYIVIIIDEFADLMATSGKELEATVARLCAMSRAVGIHLVLATQRPSINVITGLIKANIPSRIAFMVASKTDSRIILDEMGAEKLLGKGDMLYVSAAQPFPTRMQGAFVSEQEVERVVACVKEYCEPEYIDDEIFVDDDDESFESTMFADDEDPLYDQALEIVTFAGKASASYVQRKLKIGYNRAARLIEEMEARGIVGPANGSKAREVIRRA